MSVAGWRGPCASRFEREALAEESFCLVELFVAFQENAQVVHGGEGVGMLRSPGKPVVVDQRSEKGLGVRGSMPWPHSSSRGSRSRSA